MNWIQTFLSTTPMWELVVIFVVSAVVTGLLSYGAYLVIAKSFRTPRERTIQAITLFGKFRAAIMSVAGYRLNVPGKRDFLKNQPAWEFIPTIDTNYKPRWSEKWNIYFFLWPLFKIYTYTFAYTKHKKRGDVQPGDHIIRTNEDTGECLIARSGTSDYVDFRAEYPTATDDLFTKEMAKVIVFTNNTFECVNPYRMLFAVNNWLAIANGSVGAALRGVVGELSLQQLNQVKSESVPGVNTPTADFTSSMIHINDGTSGLIAKYGVKLVRSIFEAFEPADENTKALMAAFLKPKIATQEGEAAVIKATKEGKATVTTAKAKANAYSAEQEAIVKWRKKYLVDTGLAEVGEEGNITKLVPDANVRVSMEALKALKELKGTLVMSDALGKVLAISPTKVETTTPEEGIKL